MALISVLFVIFKLELVTSDLKSLSTSLIANDACAAPSPAPATALLDSEDALLTVSPKPAAMSAPDFSAVLLISPVKFLLAEIFASTFESTLLTATAPVIATEVLPESAPRKFRAPAPLQAPVKFLSNAPTLTLFKLVASSPSKVDLVSRLPRFIETEPAPSKVTFG